MNKVIVTDPHDGDGYARERQLTSAVAKAMGEIGKLTKNQKNKHGGYNFVSTDDFLAAVGPICAENGIVICQHEASSEILPSQNKVPNLHCVFDFTVKHASGEEWAPIRRSVMVIAQGPQAYGSAQSYSLKQFMRSLFQIATGDKDDPDMKKAAPLSVKGDGPQTTWHGPLAVTALKTQGRALSTAINNAMTLEDLDLVADEYGAILAQLPLDLPDWFYGDDDRPGAQKAIVDKREELNAREL